MAFDGMLMHCLRAELNTQLTGARVDKIHHPSRDEIVLHLRAHEATQTRNLNQNQNLKLLLCASAGRPRVNLIGEAPENPRQPSMFCMLLRKHLAGARLTEIRQPELDRVLIFDFDATSEIGEPLRLSLAVECTGRLCNIVLFRENGIVIDAIKRSDLTQGTARPLLPGLAYQPPPAQAGKLNLPAHGASGCLIQITQRDEPLSGALANILDGVSPQTARELSFRVSSEDPPANRLSAFQTELLQNELAQLRYLLEENRGVPILLRDKNGIPARFSFMELSHLTEAGKFQRERLESFSALLEGFYAEKDETERNRQRGAELLKLLRGRIARVNRKLELQRAELAASEDREQLRIFGELILANRARLEQDLAARGASAYRLENYYDGMRPVSIPADPARSPAANAQRYFKEYRKAKTARQMLGGLIEKGRQELQYLESTEDLALRSGSRAELDELRAELEEQGICKKKNPANKNMSGGRGQPKPLPPIEYRTTDGLRVLVGRSNLQNDRLSFQTAHGNDLWFHVQAYPGSHVILLTQGREPPPRSIEEAASIAALHSKARDSGGAAVDYTPVKLLKKPKGAPPGKVIYHAYQTIIARPYDPKKHSISTI
ncbi:MAG: NFACT family protein [Oscillospiraceae bacterium]|nr:NFACT family protein [Oscillospiraceae bacterium]